MTSYFTENVIKFLKPIEIQGENISTKQLTQDDIPMVAAAIHDPTDHFAKTLEIDSLPKVIATLENAREGLSRGFCNPVAFKVGDEFVGFTRLFRYDERRKTLEIGGTRIAPKWRNTHVNTATKRLLMKYAFETLGVDRIEYVVNTINYRSQMAMLRLGATYEGRLHQSMVSVHGENCDGFLYSVTKRDWPDIEERLQKLANREEIALGRLPHQMQTHRLELRRYALSDARQLEELFRRNRTSLIQGFPQAAQVDNQGDAEKYIADKAHHFADGTAFFWGVWSIDKLLGHVHAKNVDWNLKSAELGYHIDKDARRSGFASEALQCVIEDLMSRRGFLRLFVRIVPDNDASLVVATKLGFQKEGLLRSAFKTGTGDVVDIVMMSLTR